MKYPNLRLAGITVKVTDKLGPEYLTRGYKVKAFTRTGWRYLKRQPKRDNPSAILRDLLIRAGKYPKNIEERAGWDKTLGELYRYAEQKVEGIFVDKRIKLK